jgi:predicted Zn-dependent protease
MDRETLAPDANDPAYWETLALKLAVINSDAYANVMRFQRGHLYGNDAERGWIFWYRAAQEQLGYPEGFTNAQAQAFKDAVHRLGDAHGLGHLIGTEGAIL